MLFLGRNSDDMRYLILIITTVLEWLRDHFGRGQDELTKKQEKEFERSVEVVRDLFQRYSADDVARALFISELWLPNLTSGTKHLFYAAVLVSISPETFSRQRAINSFAEFKVFLNELFALSPAFPSVEDFIPEIDWGEIRFPIQRKQYKIFGGGDISDVYDVLAQFKIVYKPIDDQLQEIAGSSPLSDLEECLAFQDFLITEITSQQELGSWNLELGAISVPSEAFWTDGMKLLTALQAKPLAQDDFVQRFAVKQGSLPSGSLTHERFGEFIFKNGEFPFFFLATETTILPLLVRRSSGVIVDYWGTKLKKHFDEINSEERPISRLIAGPLFKFVKGRFHKRNVFPLVSVKSADGGPHDLIFPLAITSKRRLFLFYVLSPKSDEKELGDELDALVPKFNEAIEALGQLPTQLFLHIDRQRVEFQPKEAERAGMTPQIVIVVPQVSTSNVGLSTTQDLPGRVVSLTSLLGVIDEADDPDELDDFFDFIDENEKSSMGFMTSLLDLFGAFKDSSRVLIGGAVTPNFVMLDPHWGDHFRHQSLIKFWRVYPKVYFGEPRTWEVHQEGRMQLRFQARSFFGAVFYQNVGKTHAFITAPFDHMSFEQARIANFLAECLNDSVARLQNVLAGHKAFRDFRELSVSFFPDALAAENPEFKHLKHLKPAGNPWVADAGFPEADAVGVRVVFNLERVSEVFSNVSDRTMEAALLELVMQRLNGIKPDGRMKGIVEKIHADRTGKPRYKLFARKKLASFPETVGPWKIERSHFKQAKKRLAELAKESGVVEGEYSLDEAKSKLDVLRKALVREINVEVSRCSFEKSLPRLIAHSDALLHRREMDRISLRHSLEHEVDYDRAEKYSSGEREFLQAHQNSRYLIEKFVQLAPSAESPIAEESACYLLALIDWLFVVYGASDALHYGISPAALRVDRDFLIDVEYGEDNKQHQDEFAKEQAFVDLKMAGDPDDVADIERDVKETMAALDIAFSADFGFKFTSLVGVLIVLAHWADNVEGVSEAPYYSSDDVGIKAAAVKAIENCAENEIPMILDFLTLKSDEVLKILGKEDPCDDLPVWEHKKRFARYSIRPLIKVGDKYFWGPHSARRAGLLWSGKPSRGTLPIDIGGEAIRRFLRDEKKMLDEAVETVALAVVKRFTPHACRGAQLHKLDKAGGHPLDLGDYDVLAYLPEKNSILNIECKNLLPVYCLKDAKSLRETIFGEPGKDEGHFAQIDKRRVYLEQNWKRVAEVLKWPIKAESGIKIESLYVTPITYWWTRFPPRPVKTAFVRLSMLAQYCRDLVGPR